LWLYLKKRTTFFDDYLKVLDIAPVEFFQQKCKSLPNLNYISADISSSIAMIKMDITNISFYDNQFDCIICYHVLEHISNDKKAIKELFRVLKPGGWAILQSPVDYSRKKTFESPKIISQEERKRIFGEKDHLRIYGQDYKDKLEEAGFVVKLDDFVKKLGDNLIKKYGLMKSEIIYFCTKPKNQLKR
jgi:SAM-dependent methyltransferase